MENNTELDRKYIAQVVQDIVNRAHKHPEKRRIIVTSKDIQFAEPIYGDSDKNPRQKRCHLYWDTMMIVNYDDDGYRMPFQTFCKKFQVSLDPSQRMAIHDQMDKNIIHKSDVEEEYISTSLDKIIDLDVLLEQLNEHQTNSPLTNVKPIENGSRAQFYLRKRGIPDQYHSNIYQCDYIRGADWSEPCVLLLNRRGNKILGAQVRNFKDGKYRMFKVYNFEQLNEWAYPERNLDETEMMRYNKLSYYFNVMNVDFNIPVTIFEGYLDSLFMPNSIGITGLNTDLDFFEKNPDLDIRYFFDNDDPGYKKTSEKIKDGFCVFLWKKLFESIVDKKNPSDPYHLYHKISKVKDLNKLAEMVPNPYKELKLEDYFSKDIYDLRYIPKPKKVYKKWTKKK